MAREVVGRGGCHGPGGAPELPGVGPYAAGATRQSPSEDGRRSSMGSRRASIDATSGSGSDLPASNDRALWEVVEGATPPEAVRTWNWAVLDLAAAVCVPRVRAALLCPLNAHCAWSHHG